MCRIINITIGFSSMNYRAIWMEGFCCVFYLKSSLDINIGIRNSGFTDNTMKETINRTISGNNQVGNEGLFFLTALSCHHNRVGAWGLFPHASSHTTVRAVRHTAVPLSPIPSCLIEVHITTSKRGITCTQQAFIRHGFMHRGVRGHPPIGLAAEGRYTHTLLVGDEFL